MPTLLHPRCFVTLSLYLLLAWGWLHADSTETQTFELNPGWNAIFLEVQPEPRSPEAVFADLGSQLESVWTWVGRYSTVEFVSNPNEGLWGKPAWCAYFPATGVEPSRAVLTNLHAVVACRAYLIQLGGSEPATLSVTGIASVRSLRWAPNSFNLVGFHVRTDSPPTFEDFLAPCAAHAGQRVYRLAQSGEWELVANHATERVHAGEAYWVWCEGGSTYQGPLEVDLPTSDGLVYGASLSELPLSFRNLSASSSSLTLTLLSADVSLAHRHLAATPSGYSWSPLTSVESLSVEVPAGGRRRLALAVDRKALVRDPAESTLEILGAQGMRILVPVRASSVMAAAKRGRGGKDVASDHAGLWVGNVELKGVSQAQEGSLEPTPVATPFSFRVIVHVDSAGQARLLKQVVQMWQNGTYAGDGTVETPGQYVLVTDDSRLGDYQGASLRDGRPVGYRLSTVAYDIEGADTASLTGSFVLGGSLACTLSLGADHATNPFKHRYHPDHDNLDALYVDPKEEAYAVERAMSFALSVRDPQNPDPDSLADPPDWGVTVVGGSFEETITGLHKNPIRVEGTFRLQRVCVVEELNP